MIFNPGFVPQASSGGGAVVGTYTGDGAKSREIDLPFAPVLLVVEQTPGEYIAFITGKYCKVFSVKASSSFFSVQGLAISLSTSIDNKILEITRDNYDLLNSNGASYTYIAFPQS